MYELQHHKNIEMKIFNPWEHRDPVSRAGEMIAQMERLKTRIGHNKLLIVTAMQVSYWWTSNIGDQLYFEGLSK